MADDSKEVKPYQTHYMIGIIIGLLIGGTVGFFLESIVPLATLGGALGMWVGNTFNNKKR